MRSKLTFFLITLIVLFLLSTAGLAEMKEIISEGTYNMGDGETPSVAESRALLNAKQLALEEAGTYVQSYSAVRNFKLTEDEIRVLSSGLMEVTIVEKKRSIVGDGINFYVKIKARVTLDKIDEMSKTVREKKMVENYKVIQSNYEQSQKEIANLKKQLLQARSAKEKEKAEDQIREDERKFTANEFMESGYRSFYNSNYDEAIGYFTSAINMNPKSAPVEAYYQRGISYTFVKQYDKAIDDFNRCLKVDANLWWVRTQRASAYQKLGKLDKAIMEYTRIINSNPKDKLQVYSYRASAYREARRYTEALRDYSKVIDASPADWTNLFQRGGLLLQIGQYGKAIRDFSRVIKINPADYMYWTRGYAYEKAGNKHEAISDYETACNKGFTLGCQYLRSLTND